MTPRRNWDELLMGLVLAAFGILICAQAATIKVAPLYAKVGPAAFLWFSGGLLAVCGVVVAFRALRLPAVTGVEWHRPLIIMAGLVASVFTMEPLGFIPSATLIFTLTAYGMGSTRLLRDVVVGCILSAAAFFLFSKGLGLHLPVGNLFA